MTEIYNPFADDPERREIWEMLVRREIDAFLAADWQHIADHFRDCGLVAIGACQSDRPDDWRPGFPDVTAYRNRWLARAGEFAALAWPGDRRELLFAATRLEEIQINCDSALCQRVFDSLNTAAFPSQRTLIHCRKIEGRWKIECLIDLLPCSTGRVISLPAGAAQHLTAGPYSPVLEIDARKLVVICGQAAIARDGGIIGDTIEAQSVATLANCAAQLATAGCTFADVFKVNVYLTNLNEWSRFNAVYVQVMPEPRPVRTAVGTALLPGLMVEVEMWAAKGSGWE